MVNVNIHEAKTHLSRLLNRVEAGEQVLISRAGRPVARLVPAEPAGRRERKAGRDAGKVWISDDFSAPLPPEVLAGFYR
jgi:prevent-host-death family protein